MSSMVLNLKVTFMLIVAASAPNGLRYPLVGWTRQRHFDGTSFKPREVPKNAQTPISRVNAVLGGGLQFLRAEKLFNILLFKPLR